MAKRQPSKTALTSRLDREWSLIVRARNRWTCERCGQPATQVHHIYSRTIRRLRFDARNLVSTCFSCHDFAHKRAPAYHEWFRSRRPDDWAFITEPSSSAPLPRSVRDLQELLVEAKAITAELELELAA